MKIVVDKDIPFIKGRLEPFGEVDYADGKAINRSIVDDADALIIRTRTICDENLLKNSNVKFIATATIGTDHIDKEWCKNHGIIVKSAPGCNAPGVAQYVFSSLFETGFNPKKDILGIIGYGNVGSTVGKWAQEIGIKILVCDPLRQEAGYDDVEYCEMKKVLKESDAVTLHVPLTHNTSHPTFRLIGKNELKLLKPGTKLINTSRGGVVDENYLLKYLYKAPRNNLDTRNLTPVAIIDVWENEPEINKELLKHAEIATPHIAGYSLEGKKRATRMTLENFDEFFMVKTDKTGLETDPVYSSVSKNLILQSYNPRIDSVNLKNSPDSFESLRNHYEYRHEPLF